MKNLGLLIICILITACGKDVINEKSSFNIFEKQSIKFKASSEDTDNQIITLGSGRLVLKKVRLPLENDYLNANAKITLVSTGDPWDKSGSFFMIPAQ